MIQCVFVYVRTYVHVCVTLHICIVFTYHSYKTVCGVHNAVHMYSMYTLIRSLDLLSWEVAYHKASTLIILYSHITHIKLCVVCTMQCICTVHIYTVQVITACNIYEYLLLAHVLCLYSTTVCGVHHACTLLYI